MNTIWLCVPVLIVWVISHTPSFIVAPHASSEPATRPDVVLFYKLNYYNLQQKGLVLSLIGNSISFNKLIVVYLFNFESKYVKIVLVMKIYYKKCTIIVLIIQKVTGLSDYTYAGETTESWLLTCNDPDARLSLIVFYEWDILLLPSRALLDVNIPLFLVVIV